MKDSSFGRKLKLTSTWLHNIYFVWLAVNSQFQTTQFSILKSGEKEKKNLEKKIEDDRCVS